MWGLPPPLFCCDDLRSFCYREFTPTPGLAVHSLYFVLYQVFVSRFWFLIFKKSTFNGLGSVCFVPSCELFFFWFWFFFCLFCFTILQFYPPPQSTPSAKSNERHWRSSGPESPIWTNLPSPFKSCFWWVVAWEMVRITCSYYIMFFPFCCLSQSTKLKIKTPLLISYNSKGLLICLHISWRQL